MATATKAVPSYHTTSAKIVKGVAAPTNSGAALTTKAIAAHYAAAHAAAVAGNQSMVMLSPNKKHNPPGIASGKEAPPAFAGVGSHNSVSWRLVKALVGNGPQYPSVVQAMLVLAYGHGCYVRYLQQRSVLVPYTGKATPPATLPAAAAKLLPVYKGAKLPA